MIAVDAIVAAGLGAVPGVVSPAVDAPLNRGV
jgi:hypothetical protein